MYESDADVLWDSSEYEQQSRTLQKIIPIELIPSDPMERFKLVRELNDVESSRPSIKRNNTIEDDFIKASIIPSLKKTKVDSTCGDTNEYPLRQGLLQLSNFHLGVGGSEETEIPSARTSVLKTEPVGFGMNDNTFELEPFKKTPETQKYLTDGILRQDGTDKQPSDQKYYGRKWQKEWAARQKLKEQDIWYQLLVDIAGGTNTTVERLQNVQNIEAREMAWRGYAERQTTLIRSQFDTYKRIISDIEAKKKELRDLKGQIPSTKEFERAMRFSSDSLVRIESGAFSLAEYIWKERYYLLFQWIMAPLLSNSAKLLTTGTTGAADNKIHWSALVALKLNEETEQETYLDQVDELLEMIAQPRTSITGLLNAKDEQRIGIYATERRELESATVLTDTASSGIYASDYARDAMITTKTNDTLKRIQKNAKDLKAFRRKDNDIGNSAKLMFLTMYYAIERGLKLPPEGGALSIAARDSFIKAASTRHGSEPLSSTIAVEYIKVIRPNQTMYKQGTVEMDLQQLTSQYSNSVRIKMGDLKDDMAQAWRYLGFGDDVTRFAVKGAKGREELLKANPMIKIAEVRSTTQPIQVLSLSMGQIHSSLKTFSSMASLGSSTTIQMQIEQLEDKITELEWEAKKQSDMASGKGTGSMPDELPYVPSPDWTLRPEFTGRVTMQPIVRNAINQAYTLVKRYAPEVIGGRSSDEGLEYLVKDDDLRPYFVEMIVLWMFRTRHRFQVRWLPPAQGEAMLGMKIALDGLKNASGVGHERMRFRSPYFSEIYQIGQSVSTGRIVDTRWK
jgi:hypothetical protein